jgi:type 1 glutamine amidotransferase
MGYRGEADVNPNPLVWCHDFGGGRVFYCGHGHLSENYSEPYIVDMLAGALKYAVGK